MVELNSFFDDTDAFETLKTTPAAALGSCRKKLKGHSEDKQTYEKILSVLKKYNIRYFFYIGGNDSMDTVYKLSEYAKSNDYEMYVVGVPKTIDNDLMATDHTPGYGSAAKFVATTIKEIIRDIWVYKTRAVTIVEVMGRDAGWLTAAAALPKLSGGKAPDLVYLPEVTFDKDEFLSDVREMLDDHKTVLVAVSEGIKLKNGEYVGAGLDGKTDAFGHKQLSGAGKALENLVKSEIGCKVRSIELSLLQRCSGHIVSRTDIEESIAVGRAAVTAAVNRKSGVMMTINREAGDPYSVFYDSADISGIANGVRQVPRDFINESGNGVTNECVKYLAPLIVGEIYAEYENGLPNHFII
jgi:6-phosphofructokinase 1